MKLKSNQYKGLSEFLNTIAAAWFSAGVISPLFIEYQNPIKTFTISTVALILTSISLVWSLQLLGRIR